MADIYGTSGNETLNGTSDNDNIYGLAGNDVLNGDAGNDVLDGGTGNDLLQDGSGSDTYVFGVGSGTDTVQDWGWDVADVDTVLVTQGVTPATLLVTQDWATGGALTLRLAHSDDQLQIQGYNAIEQIQFADGTVWDQAAIQARVQQVQTGTAGTDYLGGGFQGDYLQGLGGDDTLYGNDGQDALLGGVGNDQLDGGFGNDVLNGGAGNDLLQDGSGSDTYVFGVGSGTDTVQDWGWDVADVDTVLVGQGVTPSTLLVTQDWATNPGGVTLRLAHSDDQLVIQNFNSMERIQFADGTVWDQAAIQARVQQVQTGTAGNDFLGGSFLGDYLQGLGGDDTLYGGDGHDALLGGAGNDTLYGDAGNDVFNGGAGNDVLQDFSGSDTYVFGVGSGTDTVQDWGAVNEIDTVQLTRGVTPATLLITEDWVTNPGGLTLRLAHSDDQLVIQNFNAMERIQFADGTVWDQTAIQARVLHVLTGSASSESLQGGMPRNYLDGRGGDDWLFGNIGMDVLIGGAGNDQLFGSAGDDILNGGSGNDQLVGDSGSDTYVFGVGSGTDTVQDWGWDVADVDTVLVTQGVTPATLLVTQDWATNPGGVTLRLAHSDDQLQIQGYNAIEQIQFADGTVWDQAAIQARVQQVQTGTAGNDFLGGSFQGDYLQGLGGDDTLYGGDGNDALMGGAGNDTLQGDAGNDVFNGGAGNDLLQDFAGSDTYVFGVGSGIDTVQDWGWDVADVDTVLVGQGVTPSTLFVTQDWATNPGGLTLRLAQSDDQLVIQNFNAVERIQFADGTVWDQAAIQARVQQVQTGTAGTDYLGGGFQGDYLQGLGGDDTLYGNDGQDALLGGAGNDQLDGGFGNDVLNGGAGNDVLQDFSGSDTYVFGVGSGTDTVQDWGWDVADVDTVLVGQGVTPSTLFVTQDWATNPGGLTLRLAHSDDQLQIQGYNAIEQIQFADGTVWDQAAIQARLQQSVTGTEGDDSLWGSAESNYMQGLGGNDSLSGNDGDDVLLGGAGDDSLNGGLGNDVYDGGAGNDFMSDFQGGSDTYRWGVGSGQDGVSDFSGQPGEIDVVEVGSGIAPTDVRVTRDWGVNPNAIKLQRDATGDALALYGWFNLNGQIEEIRFADGTVWDQAAVLARLETTLTGTEGDDYLSGSELADTIHGLGGNDSLNGQDGNDTLLGGAGDDSLNGGLGDDVLDGGIGTDSMNGGTGDDTYVVDNVSDLVYEFAGEGNDTVQASVNITLLSDAEVETVVLTGSNAINATGSAINNVLTGNSAANVLDGGIGADTMLGGQGDDTYVVDNAGDVVTENVNEGTDTVQSSISYVLGAHVENLTLTGSIVENGTGNALDNVLTGNSAANVLTGGAGNDTYVVGAGDTVVEAAGGGTDTVQSSVTYTLVANVENLTLTGSGAGNATGNALDNVLTGNSAANVLTGGAGNDTYVVEAGDTVVESLNEGTDTVQSSVSFTLGANVESLTLTGAAAITGTGNGLDNVLTGNSAANVLTGGAGNDTYVVGAGDTIVEAAGGGTDTVQSALTYTLGANLENLTLTGSSAINGTGNSLANVLTGNSAANVLTGGGGNDTYVVGAGDTIVESGGGTDTVQSAVTWTLGSNLEHLTLTGSAAISGTGNGSANILTGNSANNVLSAAGGADTLRGGLGNDTLNGGSGNDTFRFGRGEGQDLVQDNSGSADKLLYDAGINPLDLVISRQANDLRLAIHGSTDYVTVQNWYTSSSNRTETIQAGNGEVLLSTQVDQLIQAMAGFTQQTGLSWEQGIDQRPQEVQTVLAASWQ